MTPRELAAGLKRGAIAPVYLVIGEDEAGKDEVVASLVGLVEEDLRGFNVERFTAGDARPDDVVAAVRTLPMLGERRVVVFSHIERLFKAAAHYGLPIRLHAEQLSNQRGAELAAQYRALSADHLEHLDEAGAKAMASAGTVAVLLPGAFYALQEKKKPPVALLRKHQVPIAIATDCNPGTSPMLSPTLAMNMACTLFGLTPEEALAGMTVTGARALGLAHSIGSIAAGKQADLCVWRIESLAELGYWVGLPGPERRIFNGVDS